MKHIRRCTYNVNTEARWRNHSRRGKGVITRITYSECVYIVLVIQHAMRLRRVIESSVACQGVQSTPPPAPIFFRKLHDFGEEGGKLLNKKKCYDFLYDFCLKQFSF